MSETGPVQLGKIENNLYLQLRLSVHPWKSNRLQSQEQVTFSGIIGQRGPLEIPPNSLGDVKTIFNDHNLVVRPIGENNTYTTH